MERSAAHIATMRFVYKTFSDIRGITIYSSFVLEN